MATDIGTLLAKIGADVSALDVAQRKVQSFTSKVTSTFKGAASAALGLQGAVVSMVGAFTIGKIVNEAMAYESALVDMKKVTDESTESIRTKMESIPSSLGSVVELTRGYYEILSAGIQDTTEAMDLLVVSSKSAKAAHISQADTVKALTAIMAGFDGEVKSAADAADLLYGIERRGKSKFQDLVPVLGNAALMSHSLAVTTNEMGGALSRISMVMGSTAETVTGYEALLTALLTPTEELLQMTKKMTKEGGVVSAIEEVGFLEFIKRMEEYAGGSQEALAKLLGGRKDAKLALAALLASGGRLLAEDIKAMDKNKGLAEKSFQEYEQSTAAIMESMYNTVRNTMVKIGETALPLIREEVEKITAWMKANSGEMASWGQQIVNVLGMVIKSFGMLITVVKAYMAYKIGAFVLEWGMAFYKSVEHINSTVRALAVLHQTLKKVQALSIAAKGGIIGLILFGIYEGIDALMNIPEFQGAVLSLIGAIEKAWVKFKGFWTDLWLGMKQTFFEIMDSIAEGAVSVLNLILPASQKINRKDNTFKRLVDDTVKERARLSGATDAAIEEIDRLNTEMISEVIGASNKMQGVKTPQEILNQKLHAEAVKKKEWEDAGYFAGMTGGTPKTKPVGQGEMGKSAEQKAVEMIAKLRADMTKDELKRINLEEEAQIAAFKDSAEYKEMQGKKSEEIISLMHQKFAMQRRDYESKLAHELTQERLSLEGKEHQAKIAQIRFEAAEAIEKAPQKTKDIRENQRRKEQAADTEAFLAALELEDKRTEAEREGLKKSYDERYDSEKTIRERMKVLKNKEADYAIMKINEQADAYRAMGVSKVEVETWAAAEIAKIQKEEAEKTSDFGKEMQNAVTGWASSFSGELTEALWGADLTFSKILESFNKMLTQMVIQKKLIEPTLAFAFGGSEKEMDWIGKLLGTGGAGDLEDKIEGFFGDLLSAIGIGGSRTKIESQMPTYTATSILQSKEAYEGGTVGGNLTDQVTKYFMGGGGGGVEATSAASVGGVAEAKAAETLATQQATGAITAMQQATTTQTMAAQQGSTVTNLLNQATTVAASTEATTTQESAVTMLTFSQAVAQASAALMEFSAQLMTSSATGAASEGASATGSILSAVVGAVGAAYGGGAMMPIQSAMPVAQALATVRHRGGTISNLISNGGSTRWMPEATFSTAPRFHDGGKIESSQRTSSVEELVSVMPRYHDGAKIGLKSNERPAILEVGELVIPKEKAPAVEELMKALPKYHDGYGIDEANISSSLENQEKVRNTKHTNVVNQITNVASDKGSDKELAVKNINVLDPSIVDSYMSTSKGEKLVMNIIRKNKRAL